jgi:hypothetical protein
VRAYTDYLAANENSHDARDAILKFLEWDDPETQEFGREVKLVLAAAEFSREITTTVLWLNDQNLDIRCVRLRPYRHEGQLLIDIQQVIPLAEAEDYQVKLREKNKIAERVARKPRDTTRYDVTVGDTVFSNLPKRRAIYQVIRGLCDAGVDPDNIRKTVPWKTTILLPLQGSLTANAYETTLAAQLVANGRKPEVFRFFTADDELIHANGNTYAATKMWGDRTTQAIDELLKAFPGHKISYREAE